MTERDNTSAPESPPLGGRGLSAAELEAYRSDGFVIVRDVLGADDISALQAVTDEFVDRSRSMTASDNVIELDSGHTAEQPRIRRIKSPHANHPLFHAMLTSPAVLDLVESIIGPDIRWHHTKLNSKAPGGGRQVEWHTDWGYYPHTNADLLEVGIALDPITEENGCLKILPGSHLGPVWDHYEGDRFVGAVEPGSFDMSAAQAIELGLGDVSIHHVRVLHGSAPNHSTRPRRLLLQGYAAVDAWPLLAHHQPDDWPVWDERIVRGAPSRDARLDGSPVRIPLPLERALGLFDTQAKLSRSHYADQLEGD